MTTTKGVRAAVVAGLGVAFLAAVPGTALADHTHVAPVGNGKCVALAQGGGEAQVVLPDAVFAKNPNVDAAPAPNRNHPLHVLVHLGKAGEHRHLYVLDSPAGTAACQEGYVNR